VWLWFDWCCMYEWKCVECEGNVLVIVGVEYLVIEFD